MIKWSLLYIFTVHLIDLTLYHFQLLDTRLANGFDLYKFIFWLVLPLLFCQKKRLSQFFSLKKITNYDWIILLATSSLGALAIITIPYIPELKNYYQSGPSLVPEQRWSFFTSQMTWVLSWLIGWEFIHRYFFISYLKEKDLSKSLWILPLTEGLYHIVKPLPEMAAMVLFSLALTYWTIKRRSVIPALAAHFIIELELILFQIFIF